MYPFPITKTDLMMLHAAEDKPCRFCRIIGYCYLDRGKCKWPKPRKKSSEK